MLRANILRLREGLYEGGQDLGNRGGGGGKFLVRIEMLNWIWYFFCKLQGKYR